MMARRGVLTALAGGLVSLAGACGLGGTGKYRFRMTIAVDTPRGMKTGFSIYELVAEQSLTLTSEERAGGGAFRGQATKIDLPDGPVFALLRTRTAGVDLGEAATLALRPDARTGKVKDFVAAVQELGRQPGVEATLPPESWPLLVRFRDLTNPGSAELIAPERFVVARITVKSTDEAISTGIEKDLPWLQHMHPGYLSGAETIRSGDLGLATSDFTTEKLYG